MGEMIPGVGVRSLEKLEKVFNKGGIWYVLFEHVWTDV